MAQKQVEGRSAGQRSRPSECLSRQIDHSEIALAPFRVHRLTSRFGLPPATAAVLAELAFPTLDTWRATR